jgi:hypothetical protein
MFVEKNVWSQDIRAYLLVVRTQSTSGSSENLSRPNWKFRNFSDSGTLTRAENWSQIGRKTAGKRRFGAGIGPQKVAIRLESWHFSIVFAHWTPK